MRISDWSSDVCSSDLKLKSCGRPLPLIEFRIVDPYDNDVPDGEPGELLIRQPSITTGYWRQPELTQQIVENGWYRSGDIARRDEEGLYYIVDRAKDMIVSGEIGRASCRERVCPNV